MPLRVAVQSKPQPRPARDRRRPRGPRDPTSAKRGPPRRGRSRWKWARASASIPAVDAVRSLPHVTAYEAESARRTGECVFFLMLSPVLQNRGKQEQLPTTITPSRAATPSASRQTIDCGHQRWRCRGHDGLRRRLIEPGRALRADEDTRILRANLEPSKPMLDRRGREKAAGPQIEHAVANEEHHGSLSCR